MIDDISRNIRQGTILGFAEGDFYYVVVGNKDYTETVDAFLAMPAVKINQAPLDKSRDKIVVTGDQGGRYRVFITGMLTVENDDLDGYTIKETISQLDVSRILHRVTWAIRPEDVEVIRGKGKKGKKGKKASVKDVGEEAEKNA